MQEDNLLVDSTIRNYFAEMKRILSSSVGKMWLLVLLCFLCFPMALFVLLTKPLQHMNMSLWAKLSIGVIAGIVSALVLLAVLFIVGDPVEIIPVP